MEYHSWRSRCWSGRSDSTSSCVATRKLFHAKELSYANGRVTIVCHFKRHMLYVGRCILYTHAFICTFPVTCACTCTDTVSCTHMIYVCLHTSFILRTGAFAIICHSKSDVFYACKRFLAYEYVQKILPSNMSAHSNTHTQSRYCIDPHS